MKKTLTILTVLLLAAFAVFAEASVQDVTLKSTIEATTDFSYGLGYKLSTVGGTANENYTFLSETVAAADFEGFDAGAATTTNFIVKQDNRINIATDSTTKTYTLNIGVSEQWELVGGTATANESNALILENIQPVTQTTDDLHNVSVTATVVADNASTITATYADGITDIDTQLLTFDVRWGTDGNLKAGNYEATVTLSYEMV